MKRIIFKTRKNYGKGLKNLSVCQKMEDEECITHIRKGFSYAVRRETNEIHSTEEPQIFITKSVDSKKKIEQVRLRCKGRFYMTHDRMLLLVNFEHTLDIQIYWKTEIFSPKKSETLA